MRVGGKACENMKFEVSHRLALLLRMSWLAQEGGFREEESHEVEGSSESPVEGAEHQEGDWRQRWNAQGGRRSEYVGKAVPLVQGLVGFKEARHGEEEESDQG